MPTQIRCRVSRGGRPEKPKGVWIDAGPRRYSGFSDTGHIHVALPKDHSSPERGSAFSCVRLCGRGEFEGTADIYHA